MTFPSPLSRLGLLKLTPTPSVIICAFKGVSVARKKAKSSSPNDMENQIPASLKKFRQSPEIEGFYRFIYENDLRTEAFQIIDDITQKRMDAKTKKKV